tara:strand:+ start:309 stop:2756 length:2448 start_codon:yes stop_codon:yes gene_type:complete
MTSVKKSLITEAKANTHLTHLEELVLTQGPKGYQLARAFLLELLETLKGNSKSRVQTSVKWDGAPAIFAGINPENGKFFVGTKSIFNKEPKINYTKEDVQRNHGHAPGLVDKLEKALDYLPSLGINKILQGDFMFDDEMLQVTDINGEPHYRFKPNTIVYAVPVDSKLGEELGRSKFGIVFHTTYDSLDSGASYGADVSGLNRPPGVWFDDAFFTDDTGTVTLTENEESHVIALVKEADVVNNQINYADLPSEFLNIYINNEIRAGQFLENPEESYQGFLNWYSARAEKKVDSLKTEKGKTRAFAQGEEQLKHFESKKEDILNLFKVSRLLFEAKNVFISKYNNAVYNTKHFVDNGSGDLRVTNPEGYVAVDHAGNGVKFVDRLEFSRANFAMDKGFTKETVQEADASALTIVWDSEQRSTTAPLAEWKKQLQNVSCEGRITINRNNKEESVILDDSIAKLIISGEPVTSLVPSPEDGKKALKKAVLYVEEVRKGPLAWARGLVYTETLLTEQEAQEDLAVAYFPGGFKPPHRGHLKTAVEAIKADPNAHLIIMTGESKRDEITLEKASQVLAKYLEREGISMGVGKGQVEVKAIKPVPIFDETGKQRTRINKETGEQELATTTSPIAAIMYEIEKLPQGASAYAVASEADPANATAIVNYAGNKRPDLNVRPIIIPIEEMEGFPKMSATQMRKAVQENDFETFKLFLPASYNDDEEGAQEIFAMLGGGLEEMVASMGGGSVSGPGGAQMHRRRRREQTDEGWVDKAGDMAKKAVDPVMSQISSGLSLGRKEDEEDEEEKLVNEVADYLLGISVG